VLEFPCTGKGPRTWALTEAQLDEWQKDYDTIDVISELKKLRQRCLADPLERKTHRGYPKRCLNWLNRAVDWSRTTGTTVTRSRRVSREEELFAIAVEDKQLELARMRGDPGEGDEAPRSGAMILRQAKPPTCTKGLC
jgi:hypothetical protein